MSYFDCGLWHLPSQYPVPKASRLFWKDSTMQSWWFHLCNKWIFSENVCTVKKSSLGEYTTHGSLVVTKISSRGMPEALIASLTASQCLRLTFEPGFIQQLGSLTKDMSGIDVVESILERNRELVGNNDRDNGKGEKEEVLVCVYL